MINLIPKGHRFSADFESAFTNNESKSLDIHRYESCLTEFVNKHEKLMVHSITKMLVLFAAGMWAVYAGAVFWAVLLLAFAFVYERKSAHHLLVCELATPQRLLAMLINQ